MEARDAFFTSWKYLGYRLNCLSSFIRDDYKAGTLCRVCQETMPIQRPTHVLGQPAACQYCPISKVHGKFTDHQKGGIAANRLSFSPCPSVFKLFSDVQPRYSWRKKEEIFLITKDVWQALIIFFISHFPSIFNGLKCCQVVWENCSIGLYIVKNQ